jgi:hypothetical protein
MSAILVVEDGTGLADANSYVSLDEANAFFDTVPQTNTWSTQTDDQKTRLCIAATRMLDACFNWNGFKINATMALQWPRNLARDANQYAGVFYRNPQTFLGQYYDPSKVPAGIKQGCCELIRFILDPADDRTGDREGIGIDSFEVFQGVKVKFDAKYSRPVIPDYVSTALLDFGNVRGIGTNSVRIGRA